jgi:ADP-ribosylglycohydrolase
MLPKDYTERVYAGVLGKIIGVYLGRPFEGWDYERMMRELGEVNYYVNERISYHPPLIVADDDISGTFAFLRALPDYGNRRDLTPAQIGQSWLNYIIEERTVLWWGGLGNSTEHTAFLRLKKGLKAPDSGSIKTNGKIVATQIGAQIFIDGWAMVAPGDPALAADLARRAASVSHDGLAIHAAQVLAAMEALAFVESDVNKLLDTGISFIPKDSIIYRLIADLRNWHAANPDWRAGRERIAQNYGFEHSTSMVPNHALIILGLLYGESDFQKSMMIVNTCGWDTDCNSGNLGCLLGIKLGLAGLSLPGGPDWRGPVADRLYVAAAEGGRVVTDAVTEALTIVNSGRALAGQAPLAPKGGARFHFEMPGSVQGFSASQGQVENVVGHSFEGQRSLALLSSGTPEAPARFGTPTFLPPADLNVTGYGLMAAPTLYSGQIVRAGLSAGQSLAAHLYIAIYDENDQLTTIPGPELQLLKDQHQVVEWLIPDTGGAPVAVVGLETEQAGVIYLDYLGWSGSPHIQFKRPQNSTLAWPGPKAWRCAWVNGIDQWDPGWGEAFRIIQNEGRGLIMSGTREWKDYRVSAEITPVLLNLAGIAARVQGMRRFYALVLTADAKIRLVKALDGDQVLAEASFSWEHLQPVAMALEVKGAHLRGWVDGKLVLEAEDTHDPLTGGGIGLVVEDGHLFTKEIKVEGLEA